MSIALTITGPSPYSTSLVIRPLATDDSTAYRALRQRILDIGDGKYFGSSYARESQFTTEKHWHDWCTPNREHCTIGLFADEKLVGIMGVVMVGAPELRTAEWEAIWLDPQYRRCGVAKLGYDKIRQWTKDHGYQYVISLIRADNSRALGIRRKNGGVYLHTKHNEKWADGSIADVHYFVIDLFPTTDTSQGRAIRHLEETLAALEHEVPNGPHAMKGSSTWLPSAR